MSDKYFLDGFGTEEAVSELLASPTLSLVREMQFKHGLKVLSKVENVTYPVQDKFAYLMCHTNGIAVCKVWTTNAGGAGSNQTEYCFRSHYYTKSRGCSDTDRQTIRSIKLSSLMATLKRQNAVTTKDDLTTRKLMSVGLGIENINKFIGSSQKETEFSPNEVHVMLTTLLGESPNSSEPPLDLNKCKMVLDIYNRADRLHNMKKEEYKRIFFNPFYLVGADGLSNFIIGKFKVNDYDATYHKAKVSIAIVEDFKRVKSIEDYPELIPFMTMMKVSYETASVKKITPMNFPVTDVYDEGLDASFFYETTPSHYEWAYMATPCNI